MREQENAQRRIEHSRRRQRAEERLRLGVGEQAQTAINDGRKNCDGDWGRGYQPGRLQTPLLSVLGSLRCTTCNGSLVMFAMQWQGADFGSNVQESTGASCQRRVQAGPGQQQDSGYSTTAVSIQESGVRSRRRLEAWGLGLGAGGWGGADRGWARATGVVGVPGRMEQAGRESLLSRWLTCF
jgi:hypothetical protein